jgi:hypothetical protein
VPTIYSLTISASDVGSRVMVRRALTGERNGFGDVVGELTSWSDEFLTIRTRTETVTVPMDTVVAGKRVPPAVPRRHVRGAGGE